MTLMFWVVTIFILATVVGYGAVVIGAARLVPEPPHPPPKPLSATLLIAAHNEEAAIRDKISDALRQPVAPHRLAIHVVSDGSTDRTAEIVRTCGDANVTLTEIKEHVGKIAALNHALEGIGGDVVIFSDANSVPASGALAALLDRFADPQVGGVCGAPAVIRKRSGWLALAEDLYWRYDNALKRAESRLGGTVSAQGSLYAVRRELIGTVPPSVADDFFISTGVVAAGARLVFEPAALTREVVSDDGRGEFRRRVRSTERGWRGLLMRRGLLNPRRHGTYALHLLFHKVLRRLVPLQLVMLFPVSAVLAPQHWLYATVFLLQAGLYAAAIAPLIAPRLRRIPGSGIAFFFAETQVAMAIGLARVALGRHSSRWTPVRPPPPLAGLSADG